MGGFPGISRPPSRQALPGLLDGDRVQLEELRPVPDRRRGAGWRPARPGPGQGRHVRLLRPQQPRRHATVPGERSCTAASAAAGQAAQLTDGAGPQACAPSGEPAPARPMPAGHRLGCRMSSGPCACLCRSLCHSRQPACCPRQRSAQGIVSVPLFDALGEEALADLLGRTNSKVAMVAGSHVQTFLKAERRAGHAHTMVVLGSLPSHTPSDCQVQPRTGRPQRRSTWLGTDRGAPPAAPGLAQLAATWGGHAREPAQRCAR